MNRESRWLIITVFFLVTIIGFGGCDIKNPTSDLKVILDVPFSKEIYDEPEITVEPESTVLAQNQQLGTGIAKALGKNRSAMSLKNTDLVRIPLGLTNQEFLDNFMSNPNVNGILFAGTITNHGNNFVYAELYLATLTDSILIKNTSPIYAGAQRTLQIRLSELSGFSDWIQDHSSDGLYFGIKLIGTPPHDVILDILTLYTPPFVHIERTIHAEDLEEYDLEEIKSVEITGKVTNNGTSDVILELFMTSLKNGSYYKEMITSATFPAGQTITIEEMTPPFITDSDIDKIEAAVQTLFAGAHIDFEIFCYSADGTSGINIAIDSMAVDTESIVSQTQ